MIAKRVQEHLQISL